MPSEKGLCGAQAFLIRYDHQRHAQVSRGLANNNGVFLKEDITLIR
jgi:hypothetical protein